MAWGRGRGEGRKGAEGVDVDYALVLSWELVVALRRVPVIARVLYV
jgi:hypothetical protein